ncbi:MAG: hypothetical protein M3Q07_23530 [Pseudobdellovibrionaceae bacterium]|nr:hypothetical protein [Pseudobdellovibrionaceae bacterium]
MKRLFVAFFLLIAGNALGLNQCLISEQESRNPSEDTKKRLDDCVKKRNCKLEDRQFICPWAFDRRENAPSLSPEDRDLIDKTCAQCEQLAIISCGHDLDSANGKFNKLIKLYFDSGDLSKSLIFGFVNPSPISNNLNLSDNLKKLILDNESYKAEIKELTAKLAPLALNVSTQSAVQANIKKSRQLVSDFYKKWEPFHQNQKQFYDLVYDLSEFVSDWHERVVSLGKEEGCKPFDAQTRSAIAEGQRVVDVVEEAWTVLNLMEYGKRLELTAQFSENAIKQSYVKTTGKPLQELEAALASVLLLDDEIMKANLWWIELNRGGLVGSLHTTYYQYKEPLDRLIKAVSDGQKFVEVIKAIKGVPPAAQASAAKLLQDRVRFIQSDLDWLRSRGWKEQYTSQQETASAWVTSLSNRNSECGKALKVFTDTVKAIPAADENYALFEQYAAPRFMQAIKVCERG